MERPCGSVMTDVVALLGRGAIKEIARDLKVSRNTVRKVLRSGETLF